MQTNPLVIDLSHWDTADDYEAVMAAGIVGVIFKATEGGGYQDPTYVSQQHAAKNVGLKWGAYHFADSGDVQEQIDNFINFACPDPDELFCLDWEDNGGDTMPLDDVKRWIDGVETRLERPGECVVYGGNTVKEHGNGDEFLTSRRLWLCQYGDTAVLPEGYEKYWLWQFTDGIYGPSPHAIPGVGPCDINHYEGDAEQLVLEWASGQEQPEPPEPVPPESVVSILVAAPKGTIVKVRALSFDKVTDRRRRGVRGADERRHGGR
jgi:lysozyme